jgi:hypothetical protein
MIQLYKMEQNWGYHDIFLGQADFPDWYRCLVQAKQAFSQAKPDDNSSIDDQDDYWNQYNTPSNNQESKEQTIQETTISENDYWDQYQ